MTIPGATDHYFTTSSSPPANYIFEGLGFKLSSSGGPNLIALHQVYCSGCFDHMATTNPSEGSPSYFYDSNLGYCSTVQVRDTFCLLRAFLSPSDCDSLSCVMCAYISRRLPSRTSCSAGIVRLKSTTLQFHPPVPAKSTTSPRMDTCTTAYSATSDERQWWRGRR